MNNNYQLFPKPIINFGPDSLANLSSMSEQYQTILLVFGSTTIKKSGLYDEIYKSLNHKTIIDLPNIAPNPRLSQTYDGIKLAKQHNVDLILAVGGGSVIDCAKAIALGAKTEDDIWDVITGQAKVSQACDLATIPTMIATGSETNDIFVIYNDLISLKRSMRTPLVSPKFTILNPEYTKTISYRHTVNGIVDTLSHILEQATNKQIDSIHNKQLAYYFKQMMEVGQELVLDLENTKLRGEHMYIAMQAYNGDYRTILNGDWACHGFDYGLASEYDNFHGEGLSIITPNWLNYIANNFDETYDLANFFRFVFKLDGSDKQVLLDASTKLREYFSLIKAPSTLLEIDINPSGDVIEQMVEKAQFVKPLGNTFNLTPKDIKAIYLSAKGQA